MRINIPDPVIQTQLFIAAFFVVIAMTVRKQKNTDLFPISLTNELKGFSILAVIFSHIGYFLATDNRFLFPISILAGVGVNLFLLLSGFGLTVSFLNKPTLLIDFYKKRLPNILIPLWSILIVILSLDFILLKKTWPINEVIYAFFGYVPVAHLFYNLNSPIWFLTLLIAFYLVYPMIINKYFFSKFKNKELYILISGFLLILLTFLVLQLKLPVEESTQNLYKDHFLSFPLGIIFAVFVRHFKRFDKVINLVLIPTLLFVICYTAYYSGVGKGLVMEQFTSLITVFCIVIFFILKPIKSNFLIWFGIYSYEIYLIHWPILYRYDFLYKYLPASLATIIYLGVFLSLGLILNKVFNKFKV